MRPLSLGTLSALPATVARPAYDPSTTDVGIVHLGIGAFHRAQTAVYSDDALALEPGPWGICGVSLRSARVRDRLAPQDGLYTAVEKSPSGIRRRVIGSVREVLFLGDQRDAVHARLTAPPTRVVTLTVTEKGYCHDPATGKLNLAHPDIVHDLAQPEHPQSAIGLIVAALDARKRSGERAFTVVCCDNLPHNGALVRGLAGAFAQTRDPALARWIEDNASFPSTMVDRIVPATTDADIAENDAVLGLHDAAPVMHEPFRQWAIEDQFVAGRPGWESAGAELVRDVAPFEAMKLRLLNGSHSAFAYLGYLAGYEFIYQVAAHEAYVAAMQLAGDYAYAGRDVVVAKVLEILGAEAVHEVHNHHNFAWREIHHGRTYWVVRKGCTPAFPGQRGFVGGDARPQRIEIGMVGKREAARVGDGVPVLLLLVFDLH